MFESYIINGVFGWFDGQHREPTEMRKEELQEYILFLQKMLDSAEE